MINKLIEFIDLLRQSNIRISISESLDCYKSLLNIEDNILNRDLFKNSLELTLIKDIDDKEIFNFIFDLFFIEDITENKLEEMSDEDFENMWNEKINKDMEQLSEMESNGSSLNDNLNSSHEEKNNSIFDSSKEEIEEFSKQQVEQVDLEACKNILNIDQIVNAIMNKNKMDLEKKEAKSKINKSKYSNVDEKYKEIEKSIKEELSKRMVREFGTESIIDIVDNKDLTDMDIGLLSFDELDKLNKIVKKMSKKINTHKSLKVKRSNCGKIDIKSTIKHSIKNGTICSDLKFKKNKNTKSKLVVLCDVSGSVYLYVDFMLRLVSSLDNSFKNTKTYIFADKIKNIDHLMNSESMKEELERILFSGKLGVNTDYTNVFFEFINECELDNKTIVVIMGDAENTNFNDSGSDYLKIIKNKSKKIIWLNPKSKSIWYNGISKMKEYEKYCYECFECYTLRQLENFIKKLKKIK